MANNTQRKRISKTPAKTTKQTRSKTTKQTKKATRPPMRKEIKIFISAFISLVLCLCFYTTLFGVFGNFIRNIGLSLLGFTAYALPVYISFMLMHNAIKGSLKPFGKTYLYFAGILVFISLILTINASAGDKEYLVTESFFSSLCQCIDNGILCADGGIIGALGIPVMSFFSPFGARLVLIFFIIVLLAAMMNFVPIIYLVSAIKSFILFIIEKFREAGEEDEEYEDEEYYEEKPAPKQLTLDTENTPKERETREKKKKPVSFRLPEREKPIETESNSPAEETDPLKDVNINIFIPSSEETVTPEIVSPENTTPAEKAPEAAEAAPVDPTAPVKKKEPNTAIEINEEEFIVETKPYEFPPITLLDQNTERNIGSKGPDLREQAKILIETLKSFGVDAKILEVNKGPTVTRFEIQPSTGVKVSKIVNLADDIALNLAALSVRIEAPIPGKAAVGIEIPNAGNSIVRLREVIDSDEFKSFKAKTAFALGKNITGTPIITDIAKMPHVLIAGATGSGKSVCINALITSILYKADPKDVKFIMIDPKVVELSVYNGIPHLLIPVVTDPRKAAGALNWAVQEMTKRYKMFADNNVRDIKGYNELAELQGEKTLPQIIIIVDELSDLMMVAPHDVEDAICRLAQMARAAGMHLVIATQRPSVDVITGVIKANVPSRIAFAVSSQIDSRTILDMGGAEKLLGKGDMLFLPMGASKPTRIQGAFISDKEVEKVVEFVKSEDAKYDEDVLEKIESGVSGEKEHDGGDADELLPQAIEIVVEAGQASASLLQRRLRVGYSRAGRLIDELEARGIIGPHEGAKPRAVLMSRAEYMEMIMQSE